MSMIDFNYTLDNLKEYIKQKLGNAVWRIEGFSNTDTIENAIGDVLMEYSHQCPSFGWVAIDATAETYTISDERAIGVLDVHFIEPVNRFAFAPLVGLSQQLNGVSPLNLAGTMSNVSGDIAQFLQWRKSFQRVTSTKPQWRYDDETKTLTIFNPNRHKACLIYTKYRTFETIKPNHKAWLKRAALAEAKLQLGTYRRKFANSIQGPGGTTINLDGSDLITEAQKEKEEATKELKGFRTRAYPIFD